ncbi:Rnf-Nqr domain containing protein [Pseudomonas sp. 148P]|uniref:Rnf-Nqr domain containing protein n=1 Tax=Pseudomonas ulcerans TaxID=3115852 RepID=A0ABU7HM63_9PSED|nr:MULTISPECIES: Rnf-Nqr domain containing protein [unclassified Pseudomonas]MEE1921072.1 Rnf-Nqr domain containing protein [Pseudomonas sp. 147P]MEE1932579.1 Rnf-Nqr domain containing protein [Pseudomonas sp. 148P]
MNRPWLVALSLAPLLGASQTLVQAASMALLSVVAILVHRGLMTPLRGRLGGSAAELANLLLAAAVVTCQTLALQAWALELRQALGIYPELLAISCLLFEQGLAPATRWRRVALLLGGYCALFLLLGVSRELLANGTLHFSFAGGSEMTGLRLASLAPGALLLLGLLLALIKRACPKQATPDREGNR